MAIIGWRERLRRHPELRVYAQWPVIPLATIPREKRKHYLRNQAIASRAIAGEPLTAVARQYNLTTGRVSQLLQRALGGSDTSQPALNSALVPGAALAHRKRKAPLPTLGTPAGNACAFDALLREVPGLSAALDEMITADLADKPYAQRVTPESFHGELKRHLAQAHWPGDRYPYTTTSVAYESARRYLHTRELQLRRERLEAREIARATSWDLPRGNNRIYRALYTIQIDEHLLDLSAGIHLRLNDELIPLRVARCTVLVAVAEAAECVLGYYLAPTGSPSQDDMLALLEFCMGPALPTLSTPGLSYLPGACFPGELPELRPIIFGLVRLDNAMIHTAHSVSGILCLDFGATLNTGWPAMPEVRSLVESVFDYINDRCAHRPASTTGSHPRDPKRESAENRRGVPLTTFQTLNEALAAIFTTWNVTPRASLGGATPIEVCLHHRRNHFSPYVPPIIANAWTPMLSSQEVPVHWYVRENRRPHVNLWYARYNGPGLASVCGKATRIRVQFDRRDIRTLRAFSLSGENLGPLTVSTPWQRYPHSVATRKTIHALVKARHLSAQDPLAGYFRYVLEHRESPKSALTLLRVYQEFSRGQADDLLVTPSPPSPPDRADAPYAWSPDLANHRS